jgi:SAM-dependent methyltransferase
MTEQKQVSDLSDDEIKHEVKKAYSKVAETSTSCCGGSNVRKEMALDFGYDIQGIPESATESFAGCGNPVVLASLKEGEVVLDLGSGAGLDAFVASRKVGESGKVIGVDMTTAMLEKARHAAEKAGLTNIEFREGDIENLPVEDNSVDVIISNCVINLAPDKSKVFKEAFRVLRPGGRLAVSDIVLDDELPEEVRENIGNYTGCLGGAILESEYLGLISEAGFERVEVVGRAAFNVAVSAKISAYKPEAI